MVLNENSSQTILSYFLTLVFIFMDTCIKEIGKNNDEMILAHADDVAEICG